MLIGVFRCNTRHGYSPLSEPVRVGTRIRGNTGNAATYKNPQGEVIALRRFGSLNLAKSHRHADRTRPHHDCVSVIGTCPPGSGHEHGGSIDKFFRRII
uniref:Anti-FecI sigma factor, FecR n=1 Tax=Ochrobactrum sp. PW1 TaxID=1882222 RepID=A0A292GKT0_9HYPH|nr:anti-FecI sigma factor, FecR [Ochrobactrum sp. PW1]